MKEYFTCKFCGAETPGREETSSHINMCIQCNNKLDRYKRLIAKPELLNLETRFVHSIERQCEVNKRDGKYVPIYYRGNDSRIAVCEYCGEEFETRALGLRCTPCVLKLNNYRSLVNRLNNMTHYSKKTQASVDEYDTYYGQQFAKGFKVPKIFSDRKGLWRA